jgi:hypothetical protein
MNIRCPNGHVLEVDDAHAGLRALCPLCSALMEIPAWPTAIPVALPVASPLATAAENDFEDDEQLDQPEEATIAARLAPHAEALGRVRLGLSFHLAKIYTTIIGTLVVLVAIFFYVATNAQALGNQPMVRPGRGIDLEKIVGESALLMVLMLTAAVVPPVLGIIGSWLCTRVPKESGAAGPITTSLLVDKLHILLALSSPFLGAKMRSYETMLGALLHLIAFVAFMNFLRNLAIYCGRMELARQARTLLHWPYLLAGGGAVLFVISLVIVAINPVAVILLAVVVLGIGFGIFMWLVRYLLLLHQLRAVLRPAREADL